MHYCSYAGEEWGISFPGCLLTHWEDFAASTASLCGNQKSRTVIFLKKQLLKISSSSCNAADVAVVAKLQPALINADSKPGTLQETKMMFTQCCEGL